MQHLQRQRHGTASIFLWRIFHNSCGYFLGMRQLLCEFAQVPESQLQPAVLTVSRNVERQPTDAGLDAWGENPFPLPLSLPVPENEAVTARVEVRM